MVRFNPIAEWAVNSITWSLLEIKIVGIVGYTQMTIATSELKEKHYPHTLPSPIAGHSIKLEILKSGN